MTGLNSSERRIPVVSVPIEYYIRAKALLSSYLHSRFKVAFSHCKAYIPLTEDINPTFLPSLDGFNGSFEYFSAKIFPFRTTSLGLKELEKKHGIKMPKSINIIGDILTINEIPEDSTDKADLVGSILRHNFGVRAVFLKVREYSGTIRVASWRKLCGWGDTFTLHKENGCYFALDISKVFFNPRLGTERLRITNMIQYPENVIDMFAGVGPFAIQIAKKTGSFVHAIDINPNAIKFLEINQNINKVNINIVEGDAKKVIHSIRDMADRIIMNFPERSMDFLNDAISKLRVGGIIHLYLFLRRHEINDMEHEIAGLVKDFFENDISLTIHRKLILEAAPHKYLVCFDIHTHRTSS